jgi:uncharacterized membrane protein YbhN (UPF0104 family)
VTRLRRRVGAFTREHRQAMTVLGSAGALAALVAVIAGRWGEFSVALASAPIGVLALAMGLHVVSLMTRSESWNQCVRSAGGTVSRRRVFRAAGVGYAASIANGQLGFALRIAALRRSAPDESPKALALATTEVPIILIEGCLAALFSFTLVGPMGWPWWIPLVLFAAMLAVLLGARSVARHHLRGWWSGLAVMRDGRARPRVVALVTAGVVLQITRNWLLLHAVGVDASVFDATAVIIAVAALGTLPLGPSTGAGATVVILGASGVGAVAAAGVLLTATGGAAALAYAAWALGDRAWAARYRLRHRMTDRLRTRSAHAAVRGMPAALLAIPVAPRRRIERSYFGGLTQLQLARLLPAPA